ncbi:hypothetical protein ACFORH_39035 [Amycolatopsis roodepoortensis]|uniref:Uncharacterized protein n=1 Tax=Amycolatopsis roodepoortensis TaxID=700274 RepID=A0ABR9LJP8_9PSEU|nr:hypothetical protein [Amycolatopsis roodepoortensis]MBE1580510.1 hypothetical protein [Amycolatopsis roodepoortensis]
MSIWNGFDAADAEIHMDEITAEGAEYEREYRAEAGAWNETPDADRLAYERYER